MARKIIALFLLISSVLCEDCQIFNFENGMDDLGIFFPVCNSFDEWSWNLYSTIPEIPKFNENSTAFIEPAATASCVSTGVFPMSGGGNIELNVYIQSTSNSEMISAIVNHVTEDENHEYVTNSLLAASLVSGWYVWSIPISGNAIYNAYLAFVSSEKSIDSIILIDSIRYIPPGVSEEVCAIYEEPITDEPETEEPVTDEPETEESVTDEPETVEPSTEESVTEGPVTEEPITEQPETEESETEEPETEEPETEESETEQPDTDVPDPEDPATEGPTNSTFWNPLTISMVVILVVILICIVSLTFYELGKRKAKKDNETIILDVEEIPPVRIVPRVNKVNSKDFWY